MMKPVSSGLRVLVRNIVRPHDPAEVTSTPHQLSPQSDRSSVRLWFSAAQRPSSSCQSVSAIATPATQNAASIVPATELASLRMTDLVHTTARRGLSPVTAVVLVVIASLLVIPVALVAIALGLGLLQLPYELVIVLQRRPIAFPLHMVASGAEIGRAHV